MQQASEAQVQRKIQLSSAPQDGVGLVFWNGWDAPISWGDNAMDTHIDLDFHESEQQQDNEEEPDHRSQENATETSSHSADLLVDMEEGETKAVPAVVFSAEAAGEDPPDPGSVLAAEAEARPMTSQVKKCKGWSPAQERRKPVEAAFSAADEFARVPEDRGPYLPVAENSLIVILARRPSFRGRNDLIPPLPSAAHVSGQRGTSKDQILGQRFAPVRTERARSGEGWVVKENLKRLTG
eukprot:g10386.t1